MTHVTDYGYTPTHMWPSRDRVDTFYAGFMLAEGESVPQPGSTKHIWHGPGVYIMETKGLAFQRYEFDVPPCGNSGTRLGWLSTPKLGTRFDLGPYDDGRTFVDLVTFVDPPINE